MYLCENQAINSIKQKVRSRVKIHNRVIVIQIKVS
jgi:hypothetical protein